MTVNEYNICVDKYADGLFRFILKNIRNVDDARDVVQDTFEKLWIKATEVSFDKAKTYMFTTAYHTMIDKIRKEKRLVSVEEVKIHHLSHEKQYSDLQEVLHKAIENLPEIQRSVLLLRDYEGYSYEEIGEITGLNESQVKVYIYRARVFLKNHIGSVENVM